MDINIAQQHSTNYNRNRISGNAEDLAGLNEILGLIQRYPECTDTATRVAFVDELCKKISDFDGAPYIMEPSLRKLIEELENNVTVLVFLYILLCPLGRCVGVSDDSNTGAYFGVIEKPSYHGMF